jgi:hypothetical protein
MRLTARQLNRATLTRQSLLAREKLGVVEVIHRIGGLQAQEPASPYLALWNRVADFSADELTAALLSHDVVKATLQRSTLHIVSRADYRASIEALLEVTRALDAGRVWSAGTQDPARSGRRVARQRDSAADQRRTARPPGIPR